jgi:hypothetical protein
MQTYEFFGSYHISGTEKTSDRVWGYVLETGFRVEASDESSSISRLVLKSYADFINARSGQFVDLIAMVVGVNRRASDDHTNTPKVKVSCVVLFDAQSCHGLLSFFTWKPGCKNMEYPVIIEPEFTLHLT